MTKFDHKLFSMLVDIITLFTKDDVRERFINGAETTV